MVKNLIAAVLYVIALCCIRCLLTTHDPFLLHCLPRFDDLQRVLMKVVIVVLAMLFLE